MVENEDPPVAAVDASVLINLIQAGRLDLLSQVDRWRFVVPEDAASEVLYPDQVEVMDAAREDGSLVTESITDIDELTLFAELRQRMGRGEAACLALAATRGWAIASDDRGRAFRRLVRERLGEGRLIETEEIIRVALEEGIVSSEEAERLFQGLRE